MPSTRARKLCPDPDCTRYLPCPEHRQPWAQPSPRRSLTKHNGWQQQKRARAVIARDHGICHICQRPGATEADHIIPLSHGGTDTMSNMAAIHHSCHIAKTQTEVRR